MINLNPEQSNQIIDQVIDNTISMLEEAIFIANGGTFEDLNRKDRFRYDSYAEKVIESMSKVYSYRQTQGNE